MSESMKVENSSQLARGGVTSPSVAGYFRSIWAIAVYTWRESMRKKILIGFLILSLLVIFGSNFITAFLVNIQAAADTTGGTDVEAKLIKDICVTAISIFGVLITIFISASAVPTEVDNKVIYTILSKPVRRHQYLLGKFIGIQLTIILNLVLMGALFFLALRFREETWNTLLLWSLLLTYFEFIIISAFTFAVSCAATSPVLPTISGLFIYITGYMTEYLKDVYNRTGEIDNAMDTLIGWIAWGLYQVLPNLKLFSLRNEIVNDLPNDVASNIQIVNLIPYGLVYAISGYIMAYWIFRHKEL